MRLSKEQRRELKKCGRVVNAAEAEAQFIFKRLGIEFKRRGYPDFTIVKNGEIVGFVEVKPRKEKALRVDQERVSRFCARLRIPFLKWSPEDGEEKIAAFRGGERV